MKISGRGRFTFQAYLQPSGTGHGSRNYWIYAHQVDGDGRFRTRDLVVVRNVLAGRLFEGQPSCTELTRGDSNRSGSLDPEDIELFLRKIMGFS